MLREVGLREIGRREIGRREIGRREIGRGEIGRGEIGRRADGRVQLLQGETERKTGENYGELLVVTIHPCSVSTPSPSYL